MKKTKTAARCRQSYVTPAASGRKLHKTTSRKRPREVVDERIVRWMTYRRELVSCGKSRCGRCAGKLAKHGPYWYAYWKENGRTRSKYIGKILKTDAPNRERRNDATHARVDRGTEK